MLRTRRASNHLRATTSPGSKRLRRSQTAASLSCVLPSELKALRFGLLGIHGANQTQSISSCAEQNSTISISFFI